MRAIDLLKLLHTHALRNDGRVDQRAGQKRKNSQMPRGSKPGERRGGRQRGTPNKKTLLRNAELEAIAGKPALSPLDYFLAVMRSQHFPLTTRVQAALKALPRLHAKLRADDVGVDDAAAQAGGNVAELTPLKFLLSLLRSPDTPHATRFKVAAATAPYMHRKKTSQDPAERSAGKPDRYRFAVNIETAKELRDITSRLARSAKRRPNNRQRHQKTVTRLQHRRMALIATLACPCPSLYGPNEYADDQNRYAHLLRKKNRDHP